MKAMILRSTWECDAFYYGGHFGRVVAPEPDPRRERSSSVALVPE
ncbi:MAG TPA: hypothetical protein VFO26_15695 [Gaiella sp.]|nr:hypothetical protein [Gaiella sp.]HET9288998.1 hypothetical protein [Gaiella sp.]